MTHRATPTSRRSVLGLLGAAPVAASGVLAGSGTAHAATGTGTPRHRRSIPKDLLPGGEFDRFVERRTAEGEFSGTVLLASQGEPVLTRSYGMADREQSIPNTQDTLFQFASVGKVFTAVAIAQLVEQGKVDFAAPLGTYLDGFADEVARTVTVHHLLTHTHGLEDFQRVESYHRQMRDWRTPEEEFEGTMAVIREIPPSFTPGARYSYSNSGYYAAGAIVAAVSGQFFADYVRDNIFAPAGMTRTVYSVPGDEENVARNYGRTGPDGEQAPRTGPEGSEPDGEGVMRSGSGGAPFGGPAGIGSSTAPELFGFVKALWDGTLLHPATTELISSGKHPVPPDERNDSELPSGLLQYTYGMEQYLVDHQRVIRRGGTLPDPFGARASISVYPDLDWVAIILANMFVVDIVEYHKLHDGLITQEGS